MSSAVCGRRVRQIEKSTLQDFQHAQQAASRLGCISNPMSLVYSRPPGTRTCSHLPLPPSSSPQLPPGSEQALGLPPSSLQGWAGRRTKLPCFSSLVFSLCLHSSSLSADLNWCAGSPRAACVAWQPAPSVACQQPHASWQPTVHFYALPVAPKLRKQPPCT